MDIIAKETNGKSYKTFKYTYEGSDVLSFAYDDHQEITWEGFKNFLFQDVNITFGKNKKK